MEIADLIQVDIRTQEIMIYAVYQLCITLADSI